ncbi:hypothetical protein CRYUN_Cryun40dG0053600 [Craigia yunnanensis]
MASSASDVLVDCGQAIEDGDLKLSNSFLEQIWNFAAIESDEPQSKVVKYFAEALVRRAYGLHHAGAYLTLDQTTLFYYYYIYIQKKMSEAKEYEIKLGILNFANHISRIKYQTISSLQRLGSLVDDVPPLFSCIAQLPISCWQEKI